jgi:hypothetical protein
LQLSLSPCHQKQKLPTANRKKLKPKLLFIHTQKPEARNLLQHQQHFLLMIAYIPNGFHKKNDKKKWGISKNKEPAPFLKPSRYAL